MAEIVTKPPLGRAEWKKNLLAVLFGLGLVIGLLGTFQTIMHYRHSNTASQRIEEVASITYLDTTSRVYGWHLVPKVKAEVKKLMGSEVLYETTYTTDQFRRRSVFPETAVNRSQFLLYLGCSVMFGQGLKDQETLDYQLSSRFPAYQSYNYAVPGWGLGHVMAQAENEKFAEQILQRQGLVIYLFPTYHIDRLFGGLQTIDWAGGLPYYRRENDAIVRSGFIHEERWFYAKAARLWNKTFLRTQFKLAGPFARTPDELNFACQMVADIKRRVTQQFEKADFLLVLHPHSDGDDLTFCLDRNGIKWLDLRSAYRGYDRDQIGIKGDGHPTGLGNTLLANELENYLKREGF